MDKMKKKVNFDICTFCNHKCTFCSNSDSRTIKAQISLENFRTVMRSVSKYVELDELGLSAKGEVLLNSEFVKIVKSAKHEFRVPYVYISSNGALINEKKALEIIKSGLDSIKFSINALDRNEYKKVHFTDDFDEVIHNFKTLLVLKKNRYPKLKLFLSSVVDAEEGLFNDKVREIFSENFELIDGISLYPLGYTPKFEQVAKGKKITKKCSIPFDEIYINPDGTLGLCCKDYFDSVDFGSLITNDFLDVYNSKEFEEIRTMHKISVFPDNHLCKNCLLFARES